MLIKQGIDFCKSENQQDGNKSDMMYYCIMSKEQT